MGVTNKQVKILFGIMIFCVILTLIFLVVFMKNGSYNCVLDPIGYYKNISNNLNYNCTCFMPLK